MTNNRYDLIHTGKSELAGFCYSNYNQRQNTHYCGWFKL